MKRRVFDEAEHTHEDIGLSLFLDPTTRAQRLSYHEDSLVIDIHGSVIQANTPNTKAAYAIFFGPECPYNHAQRLPSNIEPNNVLTEIYATMIALQTIRDSAGTRLQGTKLLIIKTDSSQLFTCLTESVYKWAAHGWTNREGRQVAYAAFYKEVHELILELGRKGVLVKFWKVGRKQNKFAEKEAKNALHLVY